MNIKSIACLAVAVSVPVQAQVVVQAVSSHLQPQIGRDASGYTTCGIRAVVLDMKPTIVDAYDFSINMRSGMFMGTVKAGKSQASKANFLKGNGESKVVLPGPVNFWISREAEGKAMMPLKVIPAESKGYILAGADFVEAWANILAIANGERMQFATRYKNQGYDTVVSFSGTLLEEELKPLMSCLEGLSKRVKTEFEASEVKE